MPHSRPVSELMIPRSQWPQIRAETEVATAIKLLRIISEEEKLEHGQTTPLVLDEHFNLLGFVHLVDLLKNVRHLCEKADEPCDLDRATTPVKDLVTPFAGSVTPSDSILKALDIMMDNRISLVPVLENGKLEGVVKLSDIFNLLAALLFDAPDPAERHTLMRDYRF
jgi:CBS-domain-containing membrane protein